MPIYLNKYFYDLETIFGELGLKILWTFRRNNMFELN